MKAFLVLCVLLIFGGINLFSQDEEYLNEKHFTVLDAGNQQMALGLVVGDGMMRIEYLGGQVLLDNLSMGLGVSYTNYSEQTNDFGFGIHSSKMFLNTLFHPLVNAQLNYRTAIGGYEYDALEYVIGAGVSYIYEWNDPIVFDLFIQKTAPMFKQSNLLSTVGVGIRTSFYF